MKYRLGLDLGTNSIGWCALKLDGEGKPNGVLASGVRLLTPNQEAGRDPQSRCRWRPTGASRGRCAGAATDSSGARNG